MCHSVVALQPFVLDIAVIYLRYSEHYFSSYNASGIELR